MNASVSLSSIYVSFGTSMNFKPLPDTDISASLRFSFAKFMMNFLFILARSFNFLDVCDCLRVLDFKWHDRDLILSFTCRLIHFFYEIFYFFAILELCISFVTLINWYKAIWRHIQYVISLFRIYGSSEKSRFVFGVSFNILADHAKHFSCLAQLSCCRCGSWWLGDWS